jgi:chaperonin GroES
MAIDKRVLPNIADDDPRQEALVVNIAEEEVGSGVSMMEDGSAIIGDVSEPMEESFDSNLAEFIDEQELNIISSELLDKYQQDRSSRDKWENSYRKGLDLLGFQYNERSEPFQGASGVTHPLLAESVTQFQAQGYKELLPAGGPVNTQIIGKADPAKEEQAERVKEFMNYQITHVMEEYDPELDQMLFHLPLAGSAFKKVYYDAALQRAVSKFISADDLIVPYSATDLTSCERITHVVKMSENEVRKQQVAGFYRDIDLEYIEKEDRILEKEREIEGVQKVGQEDEYTLLEMHVDLNIPGVDEDDGIKVPYIVTIDEGTSEVLAVYRNYKEDDPIKKKNKYFVHYKFLPGLGFYGFGLIHMLGGLSRTATAALRQLIDAGTLSNLPAGFKARGLRIADDDAPLQPGEFRDVDAPSGDLRAGLMPLPYKEPSPTLFQLLGFVVEAGTRFATVADQKIGDSVAANAPVGTTMALMERGTKVMSAIHKRLHYAQKTEFQILAKIFKESLAPGYPYKPSGQQGLEMIKQQDFDDRVDVLPVSDPNIFSMSQRVTLAQTQLQLAQANPQAHNMYEAYRRMYEALGVKDIVSILPPPKQPQPIDPGMENSQAIIGQKLQAFRGQNHLAHIDAHQALMTSVLVKNNPQTLILLESHIMEHVSLQSREEVEEELREEIEQQTQQFGGELPQEVQLQMQEVVEARTAEKIVEMTEKMIQEEQEYLDEQGSDPLIDLKQQEINIKAMDQERKAGVDSAKLELDAAKLQQTAKIAQDKIDSQEDIAQLRANVNLEKQNDKPNN